jgi:TRAP-type C4-dicarboxylate transport system substrate-binding protein
MGLPLVSSPIFLPAKLGLRLTGIGRRGNLNHKGRAVDHLERFDIDAGTISGRRACYGGIPMRCVALAVVLALSLLAFRASPGSAEEVTLSFATLTPPDYSSNTRVYTPWAEKVNAAGKGVVHIEVRTGMAMANFGNVYDRVAANVMQIGVGIPGLVGGKFPLTDVVGLPFVADDAENGSVAYWRLYKTGLLDAEYKDIVPLALTMYLPQGVHVAKAPASLDDLKGLRLRVVSKISSDVITRLNGTPMALEPADIYAGIQRGMIDGVIMSWAGLGQLNLLEVTNYHVDTPLGTGATMVFMARKTYDALPEAVRKILDENSGESFSRAAGANFNQEGREQLAPIVAGGKHTIVKLTPQQEARWRKDIDPVIESWEANRSGGTKLLETYRKLLADAKAGK